MTKRFWLCAFGVFACLLCSAPEAKASKAQLKAQIQQIKSAYAKASWSRLSTLAQQALESRTQAPKLKAQVYLYLGGMMFQRKLKSLAWQAFESALQRDAALKAPAASPVDLEQFFGKVKAQVQAQRAYLTKGKTSKSPKAPKPKPSNSVHIGWILGWILAIPAAGLLLTSLGAGINTRLSYDQASALYEAAQDNRYADPIVTPHIEKLHKAAVDNGQIANITSLIGGVLGLGAAGLILWGALSTPKPKAASSRTPTAGTTPLARSTLLLHAH